MALHDFSSWAIRFNSIIGVQQQQEKAREEAKKSGGGVLGAMIASTVVSAASDPSDSFEVQIDLIWICFN